MRRAPATGRRIAAASAIGAAALFGAGSAAAAPPEPNGPGWAFREPAAEIALGAFSALSLTAFFLPEAKTGWLPNGLEDGSAAAGTASDLTGSAAGSVLQFGFGFIVEGAHLNAQSTAKPFQYALRSTMVEAESATLATGITFALKRLTGRCRPRSFALGKCLEILEPRDGFPSGHTAPVAAVAGARLSIALRTPTASSRWLTFGVAEAATLATMTLRVAAKAHSFEDVIGAFAVGHATGTIVGVLHPIESFPRRDHPDPGTPNEPDASRPTFFTWSGSF